MISEIKNILKAFDPIGLEEMDNVRLMDRIDTKFILNSLLVPDLLEIMTKRYSILEIADNRISSYDTTYLDTPDFLFFDQHVTGRNERSKVRYRKYYSTGVTFLEIKRKTRKHRTVKWRIENILTENGCDIRAIDFINKHVTLDSRTLKPVITNRFRRMTFVGKDDPERITLDLDMSFTGTDGKMAELQYIAIAELKSDGMAVRSPFWSIVKSLSVYPSGFSKYCVGTSLINDIPRKNILKPTLLLINKIENECNRSISA